MKQTPDDGAGVFDAFGAKSDRWPPERRAAAEQRLRDDPAARKAWAEAAKLDAVLDAYATAGDAARLAAIGEAVLAGIAARDEAEGWPFGPIGWPQGLGVASAVGLLAAALLAIAPAAQYATDGVLAVLAPTLWLGTY